MSKRVHPYGGESFEPLLLATLHALIAGIDAQEKVEVKRPGGCRALGADFVQSGFF